MSEHLGPINLDEQTVRRLADSLPLTPPSMTAVVLDCLHTFGYGLVRLPVTTVEDQRHEHRDDPAVMRAAAALVDLRNAMADVRQTLPSYMPGHEPTAADNCKHVLDLIDHGVRQIAAYVGVG